MLNLMATPIRRALWGLRMTRIHIVALLGLVVAVPGAAAGVYFGKEATHRCFIAANGSYRLSDSATAHYTVRIDNTAANPSLRLQIVDDAASADFVLVDDNNGADICTSLAQSVRIDPIAQMPDIIVALSRTPADKKIYVQSARFSAQDAAALFAVIWRHSHRKLAANH